MKTNEITETEILTILAGYDQITSENFFQHVPEILFGGKPAMEFGKKIHSLARYRFLTSKICDKNSRIWQITTLGRSTLPVKIIAD